MSDKSYDQMTDAELDDALLNQMSDEELDAQLLETGSSDTAVAVEEAPPKKPFVESVRERILTEIKAEPMRKYQQLTGFVKGFTGSDPIKAVNEISDDVAGIKEAIEATVKGVKAKTDTKGLHIPEQDSEGKVAQGVGSAIATVAIAYSVANAARVGLSKIDIKKGYKKVADESKNALDNVYDEFKDTYTKVVSPVANKPANTESLQAQILSSADKVPAGGTAEKYMGKLIDRLDNETVGGLHALKEEVYKISKNYIGQERQALREVYNKINEVLAHPENAGEAYAKVTADYSSFMKNEANYIKSKIMDKFGNATEERISKGIKSLSVNAKTAFDRLNARKTTGVDLLKEMKKLDTLKKAQEISKGVGKKILNYAAWTGATALGIKAATK